MGPKAPAAVRRGDGPARAVVVWCAALLTVLGVLLPAAPGGATVPDSPGPAPGPHEDRDRAGTLCAAVACEGQPRLKHSGPAERLVVASGAATLPERLLPAAPGRGPIPPPPAGGGTHVRDVLCPDGRAPPPPPGT